MPTLRLDQQDSYRTSFESRTVEIVPEGPSQAWVRLEASLFYPTSGGQPHDTGRLGDARVVEVELRGDEVWHLVDASAADLPTVGSGVRGQIDWPRRYRHMQRHSAQHLLSQAFLRASPALATKSVSLSGPVCTLDLAVAPGPEALGEAERLVTEAIYANLPIHAFEVDEADLDRYPLRRPPKVRGKIRLVQMGDWELSACGGTHLASSAEAGPVKLLRTERVRGGHGRVHFCCGWEALEDYALKHEVATGLARDFSAQVAELPARVAALQEELATAGRRLAELQARQAARVGEALLQRAEHGPGGRVVRQLLEEHESELLGPLAAALSAEADVTALLGAVKGDRALLLFARGEAVTQDMARLLREVLPLVDGRGGGRPELAQGGGTRPAGLAEALEQARSTLVSG